MRYSKRQIVEAISYWSKQLRILDESILNSTLKDIESYGNNKTPEWIVKGDIIKVPWNRQYDYSESEHICRIFRTREDQEELDKIIKEIKNIRSFKNHFNPKLDLKYVKLERIEKELDDGTKVPRAYVVFKIIEKSDLLEQQFN